MSRFSPDTWLDAVQLPFAMVQFGGNVYVEPIAPDFRPAAFIILAAIAIKASFFGKRKKDTKNISLIFGGVHRPRAAWALIGASALALVLWIASSANGRYGLLAITLSPLAAIAALLIGTNSKRLRITVLLVIGMVQGLFLATADPDDTWSKLTTYKWDKEIHADLLPMPMISPWRDEANEKSVLVVTSQTLTGMSTLYQVFGPKAHYMNLSYISQFSHDSVERQHAKNLIDSSDIIYWSNAVEAKKFKRNEIQNIPGFFINAKASKIKKFGLVVPDDAKCQMLPERMGAQLQICTVKKDIASYFESKLSLPDQQLKYIKYLSEKCPSIFGELSPVIGDDAGGVLVNTHDGKYFIEILQDMSIYIRHRGDIDHRLISTGDQIEYVRKASCKEIVRPGAQYWR